MAKRQIFVIFIIHLAIDSVEMFKKEENTAKITVHEDRQRRRKRSLQTLSTLNITNKNLSTIPSKIDQFRLTEDLQNETRIFEITSPDPFADIPPPSQLVDDVFVQQSKSFRKTKRSNYERIFIEKSGPESKQDDVIIVGTMGAAVTFQGIFHTAALILQGLLAGISLSHCMCLLLFISFDSHAQFFTLYTSIALPLQSVYYAIYAFCTVAVLDRYDIGYSYSRLFVRALTFQSGAISALLYFLAVVFTLLEATFDKYPDKNSFFDQDTSALGIWKWASIGRAICTLLAWLLIAARPGTDQLLKHMKKAEVCPHPFRFEPNYLLIYYKLLYTVFLAVGPLLLLILLTICIIGATVFMRDASSSNDETVTLILVVLLFISCNVVALLLNMFESSLNQILGADINYVVDLSNLLVVVNSSINFVIYYSFSGCFRRYYQKYMAKMCGLNKSHSSNVQFPIYNGSKETSRSVKFRKVDDNVRLNNWPTEQIVLLIFSEPETFL